MTQPLTDAITALTRYANEVTGASDQTLSDAVRTLCDGYGGGGSSETLPTEYQRVEYIGSGINCYINLGTFSYEKVGFLTEFEITHRYNPYGPHFLSSANSYLRFVPRASGNTMVQVGGGSETKFTPNLPVDTKATALLIGPCCAMWWDSDGGSVTVPRGTLASGEMILFSYGATPTDNNFVFAGKFYSMKIFNDKETVRNFVPCYRKSDGVIGIYDTVGQAFLANSGTGTFTKGADVN